MVPVIFKGMVVSDNLTTKKGDIQTKAIAWDWIYLDKAHEITAVMETRINKYEGELHRIRSTVS